MFKYKAKVRGLKSAWVKNMQAMEVMAVSKDDDEIFSMLSFSDINRKISRKYQLEFLDKLTDLLKVKEEQLVSEQLAIVWINVARLSESSVFVFQDKAELAEFFKVKNVENLDNDGEFYMTIKNNSEYDNNNQYHYITDFLKEKFPNDYLIPEGTVVMVENDGKEYLYKTPYVIIGHREVTKKYLSH